MSVKKLEWLGSSRKDLLTFPDDVKQEVGYALHKAQIGLHHNKTKAFKGFGTGVYEIAIKYDSDAYRSVYIVNLDDAVYVLHCFQKKSTQGIKTPQKEVDVIKKRLTLLKERIKVGK